MIDTGAQLLALVAGFGTLLFVIELVRRRQLREKYAVMWVLLAIGMGVLAFFPRMLDWLAGVLSIRDPANVLFVVAILILLGIVIHLSWELSRLETETRTLSEDLALLRLEVDRITHATVSGGRRATDRHQPRVADAGIEVADMTHHGNVDDRRNPEAETRVGDGHAEQNTAP